MTDLSGTEGECPICSEKYTGFKRKEVICPDDRCGGSCCSVCLRKYLLDYPLELHCMYCKVCMTYDFLCKYLPKSYFSKEWAIKQEEALYDREKAMLIGTQALVENKKQESAISEEIKEYNRQKGEYKAKIRALDDQIKRCRQKKRAIEMGDDPDAGTIDHKDKRRFIMPCPINTCRGFLSSRYKCGICENWICKDCHGVKGIEHDTDHNCKNEDVQSVRLIKKETRGCPSCGTPIFKISGCNQMFCVQCNVAFDWVSGRIATKNIHNPHYTEWRNRVGDGREARGGVGGGCGRLGYMEISGLKKRFRHMLCKSDISEIDRLLLHVSQVTIARYNNLPIEEVNTELRIKFMLNELTEEQFKRQLRIRDKKNNRDGDVQQLLNMFVETGMYIIREMVKAKNSEIRGLFEQLDELRKYTNEQLYSISKRYGSTVTIQYSENWEEAKIKTKDIGNNTDSTNVSPV